jgi:hypothetical protein
VTDFYFYLKEGWLHIISWYALDHVLFIAALVAMHTIYQWKKIIVLVTAFTIGHCITLALSSFKIISFNSYWVELLIPITIMITAGLNLLHHQNKKVNYRTKYLLALAFGCIHGLGFANTIQFMLASKQHITVPLFGFNIGLEIGQIVVVALLLCINFIVTSYHIFKQRWWILLISISCMLISTKMIVERW